MSGHLDAGIEMDAAALMAALLEGSLAPHRLEAECGGDAARAVALRRTYLEAQAAADARPISFGDLPASAADFDADKFYNSVHGTNCENVVGFMTIPVGVVGPLPGEAVGWLVHPALADSMLHLTAVAPKPPEGGWPWMSDDEKNGVVPGVTD